MKQTPTMQHLTTRILAFLLLSIARPASAAEPPAHLKLRAVPFTEVKLRLGN